MQPRAQLAGRVALALVPLVHLAPDLAHAQQPDEYQDLRHLLSTQDPFSFQGISELGTTVSIDGPGWRERAIGVPGRGLVYGQGLILSSPVPGDTRFGAAVSLRGDQLAIGAPHEVRSGQAEAGAVHVSELNSGVPYSFHASDAGPGDHFGSAVSVSGLTIVVGAPDAANEVGSAYVFVRPGTQWSEQAKLSAPDGADGDRFGASVEIEGDTLLVGSPTDDTDAGVDSGSVYVFTRSGNLWSFSKKLEPTNAEAGALFGSSVSISNGIVAVGAPGRGLGRAYTFVLESTGWRQEREFLPELVTGSDFGASVSVAGEFLIVGAPKEHDGSQEGFGAAYVYRRRNEAWSRWRRIVAPWTSSGTPHGPQRFGASVSVAEDTFLVGAPGSDTAHVFEPVTYPFVDEDQELLSLGPAEYDGFGSWVACSSRWLAVSAAKREIDGVFEAGAVDVYRRRSSRWIPETTLTSPTPSGDAFGSSVTVDGDTILIGAPDDSELALDAGAAYAFSFEGGVWQRTKLLAPDGLKRDRFGVAVALDGDRAAISAPLDDNLNGRNAGSVYLFERAGSSWAFTRKLRASDGERDDFFGRLVALSGDTLAVRAQDGFYNGKIYVFERSGNEWTEAAGPFRTPGERNFAISMALDGETLAIGASNQNLSGHKGAVYLHRRGLGTWGIEQRLEGTNAPLPGHNQRHDAFGTSVDLCGERLVVGATNDSEVQDTGGAGTSYVFSRTGTSWSIERRLKPRRSAAFGLAGHSVALEDDLVLVGAPSTPFIEHRAAVYSYDLRERSPSFCDATDVSLADCPCDNAGRGDTGCDLAQATGGVRLRLAAQTKQPLNRATFVATGFPTEAIASGTLLRSSSLRPGGAVVFGDGLFCLSGSIVRVGGAIGQIGGIRYVVGHGPHVGSGTFHYQLHLRNTPVLFCDPTAGFNLSNGRSVTW